MSENTFKNYRLPVCLIVMDGYGLAESSSANAISQAEKPHLDEIFATHPWITMQASGEAVGLPPAQMGNSEVGHLNIGAGRVVYQELTRINRACEDGSLAQNPVLNEAFEAAKTPGKTLHLMGLLSDGGVHSNNQHLFALLHLARDLKIPDIKVHCILDGRDVAPTSGLGFVEELEMIIAQLNNETTSIAIGSIEGRYYAMDRDNRWDRIEKAFNTIVCAEPSTMLSPHDFVQQSYEAGITDEFVIPAAFDRRGIQDGDSVVFFNFRPDRAREITRSFVDREFTHFSRQRTPKVFFVCLTEYDPTIDAQIAFRKEFPQHILADVLSEQGIRQYHIAETEKYAHVTFFLNGGVEAPKDGEIRKLIPSPKVATYDFQPEMSEAAVAHSLVQAIRNDEAEVYIVNFANCDMVGHTGSIPATIKAVEAVDEGVFQVLSALREKHGVALLTADHGNADKMLDEKGEPFTAHTTALVPFALIDYSGQNLHLIDDKHASLSNIAPTLLDIIGIPIPKEMTAKSYLAK